MLRRMFPGRHINMVINRAFNLLVACGVLLLIGLLGYQTGDRGLPIDIRERELLTPKLKPGEELKIRVRFVPLKQCATHSDRWIYDGQDVQHVIESIDYESGSSQIGIEEEFTQAIKVPFDAAPGHAKYRTITTYRCNLIQNWFWPLVGPQRETEFEIVPLAASDLRPVGTGTYTAVVPGDDPTAVTLQLEPTPTIRIPQE